MFDPLDHQAIPPETRVRSWQEPAVDHPRSSPPPRPHPGVASATANLPADLAAAVLHRIRDAMRARR